MNVNTFWHFIGQTINQVIGIFFSIMKITVIDFSYDKICLYIVTK